MPDTADAASSPSASKRYPAVKPVDAAGLVLIRQSHNGPPEVLLGRRHMRSGFLPDIYVVPGGRVDDEDNLPSGFPEAPHPAVAAMLDSGGCKRPVAAFLRAALRETHEETGLLVGREMTKPMRDEQVADLHIWRAYAAANLVPDLGSLDFLLRAITPVTSPRRYNTRFFLADGGQAAGTLIGNGELEDLGWRRQSDLADLNIVDVTHAVLAEAFRRWEIRAAIGMTRPKLLNYKNNVMTLSHHRDRGD
ncbi:NUDIX domain-containing protein [Dongia soli]|uniref:NUDIX domain-containing protein n=1 Tax=Dongia soli TaxID=600628 RepID=A0ABU5EHF8_9PROT|nr:NUDIX domain-containing protein [Dongia soli]MDY0885600.1 NUDIX domain-containing protein [Dongia soli]